MADADTADVRFAVCTQNGEHPASLEKRKLYPVLPDAATRGLIRVVDESGEDYLYPAEHFLVLPLSPAVEQALLEAS